MAGSIYEIRAALKASVDGLEGGGYTLAAARVKLGYKVLDKNADMIRQLLAEGPYMLIRTGIKTAHEQIGTSRRSTYEIPIDLWVGIDRNADDDMTNLETLLEGIDAAWVQQVTSITWDVDVFDTRQNSAMVHYSMVVEVQAGC